MDEQLIMERTGHRSIDGVRAYKRSCNEQQAVVYHMLSREKNNNQPLNDATDSECQEEDNQPPLVKLKELDGEKSQPLNAITDTEYEGKCTRSANKLAFVGQLNTPTFKLA